MTPGNNGHEQKEIILVEEVADPCPSCGGKLTHQEGIAVCHNCGWQSLSC